ncbi:uncharacterized protein DEA37_0010487, partial [Paragonimus westermani]
ELKSKNVLILKPTKRSGGVVVDETRCVDKVLSILSDRQKFRFHGQKENSCLIEQRVCHQLEVILKHRWADEKTYKHPKPGGYSLPQLYGLPKIHKQRIRLRPIVAVSNSLQHKLARWLVEIFKPVTKHFDRFNIKDSPKIADDLDRTYIESIAFKAAENAGIPTTLRLQDMLTTDRPDWNAVMSYVTSIYRRFEVAPTPVSLATQGPATIPSNAPNTIT